MCVYFRDILDDSGYVYICTCMFVSVYVGGHSRRCGTYAFVCVVFVSVYVCMLVSGGGAKAIV